MMREAHGRECILLAIVIEYDHDHCAPNKNTLDHLSSFIVNNVYNHLLKTSKYACRPLTWKQVSDITISLCGYLSRT